MDDSTTQEEAQYYPNPFSRCSGCRMKVTVLIWGGLPGMLISSHRRKPCRNVAVELAEVSSNNITEEMVNQYRGQVWTIRR